LNLFYFIIQVDRDSGSIRARYMLQILLAARCAVTFVAIDTARPMHYRDDLRFMGIKVGIRHACSGLKVDRALVHMLNSDGFGE